MGMKGKKGQWGKVQKKATATVRFSRFWHWGSQDVIYFSFSIQSFISVFVYILHVLCTYNCTHHDYDTLFSYVFVGHFTKSDSKYRKGNKWTKEWSNEYIHALQRRNMNTKNATTNIQKNKKYKRIKEKRTIYQHKTVKTLLYCTLSSFFTFYFILLTYIINLNHN